MIISCFTNSYGPFGPQAAFQLLPQAGIRWVELPIKNFGVPSFFKEIPLLTDESGKAEIMTVKSLLESTGVQLSSCNISSGNPMDQNVLQRTLAKIEIAGQLQVSRVVAGAGEATCEDDWPKLIESLRLIGDVCEAHGILYCCETHPGVCQNGTSMLNMLERVDHPHVRLNFDTGNLCYYNESPDLINELRRVMPYVKHVHLKDTNGKYKCWHFPALGKGGAVDFVKVREVFEEFGFNGPASLELEGIEGEPELTLEDYQQRVLTSVQHLKKCGYTVR